MSTVIIKTDFDTFCYHAVSAVQNDPRIEASITDPTEQTMRPGVTPICLLAFVDAECVGGVVILDGELGCLWAQRKGAGAFLVRHAVDAGAYHLNCFDVGLVEYYQRLGFVEYKREANWTAGEPDVVFMSLTGEAPASTA